MSVALISDLHSNIEALNEVLADIDSQNVDGIVCLGDLVGYGPNPAEVVDHAMEWKAVLKGNHDEAVTKDAYGFNPVARAAVRWTRGQLKPGLLAARPKRDRWEFLANLGVTHREDGALMVHGSPRDPTMEYVLRSDCAEPGSRMPEKLRDIFFRFERVCFTGHTHDPGVISDDGIFRSPKECTRRSDDEFEFAFEPGRKYLVNVGSVGQPRDGDTRACYAIYSGDRVRWRRISYDYRRTMEKIFSQSDLDRRAGDRLAVGR